MQVAPKDVCGVGIRAGQSRLVRLHSIPREAVRSHLTREFGNSGGEEVVLDARPKRWAAPAAHFTHSAQRTFPQQSPGIWIAKSAEW